MRVLLLGAIALLSAGPAGADERANREPARACPRYGPGFVEVPGTTSCIRIGGRVRAEYQAVGGRVRREDIAGFRSGGYVSVDSRTETAYGPLRSYVRVRAGQDTGHP